jgi:SAM-dependent methyltransferase
MVWGGAGPPEGNGDMSNVEAWDRAALRYQDQFDPPAGAVPFGPGLPDDAELRILPSWDGKRVLELGCGAGQAAVAFARRAATTIAIDSSSEQLAAGRRLAERQGAKVDFHLGDLSELAFVPAESSDLAFSAATLDYVEDLGRVLRAVHRVLQPRGTFVFTLEHPFALCLEAAGQGLAVSRSYVDPEPVKVERYGELFLVQPRTVAEVVGALHRTGFRLEALAEPVPDGAKVPAGMVWRARKDGR